MLISWRHGVSGNFATASNWNPGAVPGPSDDATIGAQGTYTVTSSVAETVDSLIIDKKHATLSITGPSTFTTTTGGVNDGTILVDNGSALDVGSFTGTASLTNFGKIQLNGGSLSLLATTLVNGAGGVIDATTGGGGIEPGSAGTVIDNSGTLEFTGGPLGIAGFVSITINNTPRGVIEANGVNAEVDLVNSVTIVGGTLETRGANAVILDTNDGVILDGSPRGNPVNIDGKVAINHSTTLQITGTINNTGAITTASGLGFEDSSVIAIDGEATLKGGGQIIVNTASSIIGGVLTNVDNVISGSGFIGEPALDATAFGILINETKGIIDANASTPLILTAAGTDTNAGLMEATRTGTLLIESVTIDNFLHHTKGTVEAGQNSTVGLEDATIIGGFVKALPVSMIEAEQGSNTITGAHVKNAGTIGAETGNLTIVGDVNNHNGDLDANNATLVIDGAVKGGTATLEGTGKIEFDGASSAHVTFAAELRCDPQA